MKILIIDNYDSFVYNLVQYVGEMEEGHRDQVKVDQNQLFPEEGVFQGRRSPHQENGPAPQCHADQE